MDSAFLHCSLPVLGWPFLAGLEGSHVSPFVLLVVTIQQELLQLPPQLSDRLLGPAGQILNLLMQCTKDTSLCSMHLMHAYAKSTVLGNICQVSTADSQEEKSVLLSAEPSSFSLSPALTKGTLFKGIFLYSLHWPETHDPLCFGLLNIGTTSTQHDQI